MFINFIANYIEYLFIIVLSIPVVIIIANLFTSKLRKIIHAGGMPMLKSGMVWVVGILVIFFSGNCSRKETITKMLILAGVCITIFIHGSIVRLRKKIPVEKKQIIKNNLLILLMVFIIFITTYITAFFWSFGCL